MNREIGLTVEALATARADRDAEMASGAKLLQERATLAAKQSAAAGIEARLRELRQRETELGTRRRQLETDQRAIATRTVARRRDLELLVSNRKATLAEGPSILAAADQRDALQMAIGRSRLTSPRSSRLSISLERRVRSMLRCRPSCRASRPVASRPHSLPAR